MSYGWPGPEAHNPMVDPPPAPARPRHAAPERGNAMSVWAMVRADLEHREHGRIVRYDGDPLGDSYQQVLNLACFLRQALADRDAVSRAAAPHQTAAGMPPDRGRPPGETRGSPPQGLARGADPTARRTAWKV